jgi:hypothetical protein
MTPEQQGQPPAPPPGTWGAAPPGYGAPGAYPPNRPMQNGLGIAALVLGILAMITSFFFIGGLLGLVAVILGFVARGKAKRGEADNGGMALAGIITGGLGILGTLLIVVLVGVLLNNSDFKNYTDCASHANTVEERQKCADDFSSSFGQ